MKGCFHEGIWLQNEEKLTWGVCSFLFLGTWGMQAKGRTRGIFRFKADDLRIYGRTSCRRVWQQDQDYG